MVRIFCTKQLSITDIQAFTQAGFSIETTLPTRRESAYAAWVSIAVGCNNTCTFCIVPSLRGKQREVV